MHRPINCGWVRECDLGWRECDGPEMDCNCEPPCRICQCNDIPVMIIPLYPEEFLSREVQGELRFGNPNEIAPWTRRLVDGKLATVSHRFSVRPHV